MTDPLKHATSNYLVVEQSNLTDDAKYALITSNLQDVVRGDIIKEILPLRPLKIYWGTATTGRPHAAYFVLAIKLAQFLQVGCSVKVLLANLHGFLDADKAPEGVQEYRAQYCERVIRALLRSVGVEIANLVFVRGSLYQLSTNYTRDLLRLSKKLSIPDAIKASSETVKTMGEPVMADGVYPMMQLLDEEYLDVDAEFGGIDQRKTFIFANDTMHKMGFKTRAHIMNPMVPGFSGGNMSSSDPKSKIDLLDDAEIIRKKMSKAYCAPCEVEGNGILAFIQHILLPFSALQSPDGKQSVSLVLPTHAEATEFTSYAEIISAYESDILTPQLVKKIVVNGLIKPTAPIQQEFEADKEWQAISSKAYPLPSSKSISGKQGKSAQKKGKQITLLQKDK
jgi:tyrosyl-tRNA synthetase